MFIPVYLVLVNLIILETINEGETMLVDLNSAVMPTEIKETIQNGKTPAQTGTIKYTNT
jgi:hypothetical protein